MNLATGTRLGPYEILAPLGAGGMGEVYRARDTRLNRDVAIKVLPAAFGSDLDHLRRFEQEAHTTSALNHPNILTVYDIGTHDGSPFIVAELLEGEELREQLKDSALPTRKAIDYAQQIASGLAAAHSKGITHRDLKPENLFVTIDGRVKILDFGLAKLRPPQSGPVESGVATQKAITDPGVVLGTAGYMSPEQVRGKDTDHRSDIFSFGVVLYEMLCGSRPFQGDSAIEVMNAILNEEPPELSEANAKVNPALDKIVRRCLEKKPERRFQSASDLCFALETLSTTSGSQISAAVPAAVGRWNRERLAWIAATAILLLGLIAALLFLVANSRRTPTDITPTRFVIAASEKQSLLEPSISPDGHRLVYRTSVEGKQQLWVRQLDSLTAQPLPGTDKSSFVGFPFWSPDSRYIGFFADGRMKKMEVSGGPAQALADAPNPRGGTWNRGGDIVFSPDASTPLYRVAAAGGEAAQLTTLDEARQETSHRWPFFLPDGRHYLFLARCAQRRENSAIYVGSLDSKETKRLISADSSPAYAPPGYLLFSREGTLMAQPFDADKLQVNGEAFPIVEQITYNVVNAQSGFSVSANGVLVYITSAPPTYQLTWLDRGGRQLGTVGPSFSTVSLAVFLNQPRLSPDEKRVALVTITPNTSSTDIWMIELARGVASPFISDPATDASPIWSPDGNYIAFTSDRGGAMNLYRRPSSGAGDEDELLKSTELKWMMDWSPDGRFILYRVLGVKSRFDIWVLPLFGERKPYPLLQSEFNENWARFSPDGKWVAYVSDESGTDEVYVREFEGAGSKWRVSPSGGSYPCWKGDGKELFYVSGGKVMAVDVKASGSDLVAGVPKPLFERGGAGNYDVSKDGQRFLLALPVEASSPGPITVVLNWTADLKR